MKHTPKPDGTRWMMRNGQVSGPLKETGYPEREYPLTDGRHRWTLDGHFNASRSQHSFDLLYPVTVTPLLDPEPEEPKPPKEVWVNVYRMGTLEVWGGGWYRTEAEADQAAFDCVHPRIGHAIRYVLPEETERGFSEEERTAAWHAFAAKKQSEGGYANGADHNAFRAALSAISQHRSKKP